jgi:hypothetical protein
MIEIVGAIAQKVLNPYRLEQTSTHYEFPKKTFSLSIHYEFLKNLSCKCPPFSVFKENLTHDHPIIKV